MCLNCESSTRNAWGPWKTWQGKRAEFLTIVARAKSVPAILEKCEECGSLWVAVPYEPYMIFTYWIKWNYSIDSWKEFSALKKGALIHTWHLIQIQKYWEQIIGEAGIEAHNNGEKIFYGAIKLTPFSPKEIRQVETALNEIVLSFE